MKHARCASWAALAGLLGLAWTAYAQQEPAPMTASDPVVAGLISLLQGGGLPAVLALAAWWARGLVSAGIPVTMSLSAPDRELLRLISDGEARTSALLLQLDARLREHEDNDREVHAELRRGEPTDPGRR